jgi:hypothetical protein
LPHDISIAKANTFRFIVGTSRDRSDHRVRPIADFLCSFDALSPCCVDCCAGPGVKDWLPVLRLPSG